MCVCETEYRFIFTLALGSENIYSSVLATMFWRGVVFIIFLLLLLLLLLRLFTLSQSRTYTPWTYNPNARGSDACRGSNSLWTRTLDRYTRAGIQHNVRASAGENTGQNIDKGHTPNPGTEIKIPDPAGNWTTPRRRIIIFLQYAYLPVIHIKIEGWFTMFVLISTDKIKNAFVPLMALTN